jgi:hypothetical protein
LSAAAPLNPDELEVAPGFAHEKLEGSVFETATEEDLRAGLGKAFDYRGDVTITKKDGVKVEGYIFDRRAGKSAADSFVRMIPKSANGKIAISYSDIASLAFTGRDPAAGKSWEAWVKKYMERKAAGETQIALEPDTDP